ncbi:MAG: hypothetical protein ACK5XL_08675, partial [Cyclobacteriaceae bacterium]
SLSLPSGDFKTDFIEQVGDFGVWKGKATLAMKHEKDIFVGYGDAGEDDLRGDTLTVAGKNPGEMIRNESKINAGIRHWFANYFYAWGEHTVRSRQTGTSEGDSRHVFYVNKIRF